MKGWYHPFVKNFDMLSNLSFKSTMKRLTTTVFGDAYVEPSTGTDRQAVGAQWASRHITSYGGDHRFRSTRPIRMKPPLTTKFTPYYDEHLEPLRADAVTQDVEEIPVEVCTKYYPPQDDYSPYPLSEEADEIFLKLIDREPKDLQHPMFHGFMQYAENYVPRWYFGRRFFTDGETPRWAAPADRDASADGWDELMREIAFEHQPEPPTPVVVMRWLEDRQVSLYTFAEKISERFAASVFGDACGAFLNGWNALVDTASVLQQFKWTLGVFQLYAAMAAQFAEKIMLSERIRTALNYIYFDKTYWPILSFYVFGGLVIFCVTVFHRYSMLRGFALGIYGEPAYLAALSFTTRWGSQEYGNSVHATEKALEPADAVWPLNHFMSEAHCFDSLGFRSPGWEFEYDDRDYGDFPHFGLVLIRETWFQDDDPSVLEFEPQVHKPMDLEFMDALSFEYTYYPQHQEAIYATFDHEMDWELMPDDLEDLPNEEYILGQPEEVEEDMLEYIHPHWFDPLWHELDRLQEVNRYGDTPTLTYYDSIYICYRANLGKVGFGHTLFYFIAVFSWFFCGLAWVTTVEIGMLTESDGWVSDPWLPTPDAIVSPAYWVNAVFTPIYTHPDTWKAIEHQLLDEEDEFLERDYFAPQTMDEYLVEKYLAKSTWLALTSGLDLPTWYQVSRWFFGYWRQWVLPKLAKNQHVLDVIDEGVEADDKVDSDWRAAWHKAKAAGEDMALFEVPYPEPTGWEIGFLEKWFARPEFEPESMMFERSPFFNELLAQEDLEVDERSTSLDLSTWDFEAHRPGYRFRMMLQDTWWKPWKFGFMKGQDLWDQFEKEPMSPEAFRFKHRTAGQIWEADPARLRKIDEFRKNQQYLQSQVSRFGAEALLFEAATDLMELGPMAQRDIADYKFKHPTWFRKLFVDTESPARRSWASRKELKDIDYFKEHLHHRPNIDRLFWVNSGRPRRIGEWAPSLDDEDWPIDMEPYFTEEYDPVFTCKNTEFDMDVADIDQHIAWDHVYDMVEDILTWNFYTAPAKKGLANSSRPSRRWFLDTAVQMYDHNDHKKNFPYRRELLLARKRLLQRLRTWCNMRANDVHRNGPHAGPNVLRDGLDRICKQYIGAVPMEWWGAPDFVGSPTPLTATQRKRAWMNYHRTYANADAADAGPLAYEYWAPSVGQPKSQFKGAAPAPEEFRTALNTAALNIFDTVAAPALKYYEPITSQRGPGAISDTLAAGFGALTRAAPVRDSKRNNEYPDNLRKIPGAQRLPRPDMLDVFLDNPWGRMAGLNYYTPTSVAAKFLIDGGVYPPWTGWQFQDGAALAKEFSWCDETDHWSRNLQARFFEDSCNVGFGIRQSDQTFRVDSTEPFTWDAWAAALKNIESQEARAVRTLPWTRISVGPIPPWLEDLFKFDTFINWVAKSENKLLNKWLYRSLASSDSIFEKPLMSSVFSKNCQNLRQAVYELHTTPPSPSELTAYRVADPRVWRAEGRPVDFCDIFYDTVEPEQDTFDGLWKYVLYWPLAFRRQRRADALAAQSDAAGAEVPMWFYRWMQWVLPDFPTQASSTLTCHDAVDWEGYRSFEKNLRRRGYARAPFDSSTQTRGSLFSIPRGVGSALDRSLVPYGFIRGALRTLKIDLLGILRTVARVHWYQRSEARIRILRTKHFWNEYFTRELRVLAKHVPVFLDISEVSVRQFRTWLGEYVWGTELMNDLKHDFSRILRFKKFRENISRAVDLECTRFCSEFRHVWIKFTSYATDILFKARRRAFRSVPGPMRAFGFGATHHRDPRISELLWAVVGVVARRVFSLLHMFFTLVPSLLLAALRITLAFVSVPIVVVVQSVRFVAALLWGAVQGCAGGVDSGVGSALWVTLRWGSRTIARLVYLATLWVTRALLGVGGLLYTSFRAFFYTWYLLVRRMFRTIRYFKYRLWWQRSDPVREARRLYRNLVAYVLSPGLLPSWLRNMYRESKGLAWRKSLARESEFTRHSRRLVDIVRCGLFPEFYSSLHRRHVRIMESSVINAHPTHSKNKRAHVRVRLPTTKFVGFRQPPMARYVWVNRAKFAWAGKNPHGPEVSKYLRRRRPARRSQARPSYRAKK